jgi:hypothetical protein
VVPQTEIEFVYKNSIYFALQVHRQEYRNELKHHHLAPSPSSLQFNLHQVYDMNLFLPLMKSFMPVFFLLFYITTIVKNVIYNNE